MSPATNFQYPGTAFRKTATMFFTNDNFQLNPQLWKIRFHPVSLVRRNMQYGKLANWGYGNNNDLGRPPRETLIFISGILESSGNCRARSCLGVDYSANRSTHLPWSGTNNQDFITSSLLAQISAAVTPTDPTCQADSCVSNFLQTQVDNPFAGMFKPMLQSDPVQPVL